MSEFSTLHVHYTHRGVSYQITTLPVCASITQRLPNGKDKQAWQHLANRVREALACQRDGNIKLSSCIHLNNLIVVARDGEDAGWLYKARHTLHV